MAGSSVAALLAHFRPRIASMLAQPQNEAAEPAQPAPPPPPAAAPESLAGPVIDPPQPPAANAPAQPPPSEEVEEQVGCFETTLASACSPSPAAIEPLLGP